MTRISFNFGRFDETVTQGWAVALVAVFSYATARVFFHLDESYWAPIAAVVVLYPDVKSTRRASLDRFLGTLIGCLVGWAGAQWWHQHILLYGLAIFMGVGICWLLSLQNASRLCAVAITVITLIPRMEPAWQVALYRFVEVSYGVVCALVYALLQSRILAAWQRKKRGAGIA
jgi:uncharacterized membrane protein YgaE (UPF0421/DUF939 family)